MSWSSRRTLLVTGVAVLAAVTALPALHQFVPHQWAHDVLSNHSEHAWAKSLGHIGSENPIQSGKRFSDCPRNPPPFIDDSFPQPEVRQSRNGRLATTLKIETVPTEINGKEYVTTAYERSFPGPTILFCPGDTLRMYVRNYLNPDDFSNFDFSGQTSFHTHGLHVSPRKPQDNIYVKIAPGTTYAHRYAVPTDHRPGAYWYHPHRHGQTNVQAFGGAAGAMLVQGGLDKRRDYKDIGQRVIVIQQTTLDDETGTTVKPGPHGPFVPPGAQIFVNGELNPTIPIKPGEIQRWHILNLTAGTFVDLGLEGQPFQLLGRDGNYIPRILDRDQMLISPSSRREVLIEGPPAGTEQELVALPFSQFGGPPSERQTLATLESEGAPDRDPKPSSRVHRYRDLRDLPVDNRHEIVYSQEPPNFFINGEKFDPRRLDEVMKMREVSEWTVRNDSAFWHTFHIHIQDFQVTHLDGKRVKGLNFQDNMAVPPGGSFTMRTRPTQFIGKFVFHCHVLGHEDNGMMGTVRVRR